MEATSSKHGRTRAALERWCAALPADTYSVMIVGGRQRNPEAREYSAAQLAAAAQFLRHRNACGANIYVRPLSTRHVLVDDLDADGLGEITTHHRVAAIVETSPWNWQVWLSVSAEPLDPGLASAASRWLARRYDGDPGAANAFQHGRAPGLTNRKTRHERSDGSYPWAILHHAAAVVDPGGADLLREVAAASPQSQNNGAAAAGMPSPKSLLRRTPGEEHAAGLAALRSLLPQGVAIDRSRADYAIARRLLHRGAPIDEVEAVLLSGAKAAGMSQAAAEAYARRTAAAVSPEVWQ